MPQRGVEFAVRAVRGVTVAEDRDGDRGSHADTTFERRRPGLLSPLLRMAEKTSHPLGRAICAAG
jgi:hypothetical protein